MENPYMNKKVNFVSFGYRYGPPSADFILSVRHFPNPSKSSRDRLTGLSSRLQKEIFQQKDSSELYTSILTEIDQFVNNIEKEEVTIAVGCEEGKHRSVAIIEKLAREVVFAHSECEIHHRDLERKKKQIKLRKKIDQRRNEKQNLEKNIYDE